MDTCEARTTFSLNKSAHPFPMTTCEKPSASMIRTADALGFPLVKNRVHLLYESLFLHYLDLVQHLKVMLYLLSASLIPLHLQPPQYLVVFSFQQSPYIRMRLMKLWIVYQPILGGLRALALLLLQYSNSSYMLLQPHEFTRD